MKEKKKTNGNTADAKLIACQKTCLTKKAG